MRPRLGPVPLRPHVVQPHLNGDLNTCFFPRGSFSNQHWQRMGGGAGYWTTRDLSATTKTTGKAVATVALQEMKITNYTASCGNRLVSQTELVYCSGRIIVGSSRNCANLVFSATCNGFHFVTGRIS